MIIRRRMPQIARRQQIPPAQSFVHRADEPAVHDDAIPSAQILRDKFVFGGNIRQQRIVGARERNRLALSQRLQRNQNIVSRIELEDRILHVTRFRTLKFIPTDYRKRGKSCQMASISKFRLQPLAVGIMGD